MDPNPIIKMIYGALSRKVFTGAALIVIKDGGAIIEQYFGALGLTDDYPADKKTLFDLASLTKVLATTPCWMKVLAEEPELLDAPITRWFPELPADKRGITPRHLLAHSSGLHAWQPYYLYDKGPGQLSFVLERVFEDSLAYPVGQGSLYSDLGFILLGHILERLLGQRLEDVCRELVYKPLGLSDELMFLPSIEDFRITQTRSGDLPGVVNDLNARAMGGVSGHAGLFGTCRGVANLASEFLKSFTKPEGFFDHGIMKLFVERCRFVPDSSRALGFDTKSEVSSSCGTLFSQSSFGHTGFTGTSMWVDPVNGIVASFLTNRVVMGEPDLRIKTLRPELHDQIIKTVQDL